VARYARFSSAELVKACARSKDEAAWAELIRRSQPVIAAAVLRTARHWGEPIRSELDDLIQDTYLKLCEDDSRLLQSFESRHEGAIYGFLRVVASNIVYDHFKAALAIKRGAGQTDAITEPAEISLKTASPDSFTSVSQRLQLEQIDRVLRLVTAGKDQERKRIVFWLRHRQGLTAREIAAFPPIRLTTEGVESMLLRLSSMVRGHLLSSSPHREVKVLPRQSRSKRTGS
jgi:RNA polymerase sigma-70 factor (ECF subfamily)